MPLTDKKNSYTKSNFLSWACCLPCSLLGALACMVCCNCNQALKCICDPCVDDENLRNNAKQVATYIFTADEKTSEKLMDLTTQSWNPSIFLFDTENPLRNRLCTEAANAVLEIFNTYNFGAIKSEVLEKKDLEFIGNELKKAIFAKLPNKEDFDRRVALQNVNFKNAILADIITDILVDNNFIKGQLNQISDNLELKRTVSLIVKRQTLDLAIRPNSEEIKLAPSTPRPQ